MSESEIRKNIKRRIDRIHNMKLLKAIETLLEGFEKENAGDWLDELPDEVRKELDAALSEAEGGGAFKTTGEVMSKNKKWL